MSTGVRKLGEMWLLYSKFILFYGRFVSLFIERLKNLEFLLGFFFSLIWKNFQFTVFLM